MKRSILALSLIASVTLAGCQESIDSATSDPASDDTEPVTIATTALALADGNTAGTVEITRAADQVSVSIDAINIASGPHGFHLHTTGACDSPDFKSAGGHLNPDGNTHGKLSDGGKHLGDLPNLEIDESGSGKASVALGGDADAVIASILDEDGTAVVIHAGPDDYKSNPAGDAGSRIACGVLEAV